MVVDMVCKLRREIKNLLALVQVVHVGGSSKVFACVLESMTCILFVCTMYCSDVRKAMHIDFGTCRLTSLSPYQFCVHTGHIVNQINVKGTDEFGGKWWPWVVVAQ